MTKRTWEIFNSFFLRILNKDLLNLKPLIEPRKYFPSSFNELLDILSNLKKISEGLKVSNAEESRTFRKSEKVYQEFRKSLKPLNEQRK